MSGTIASPKVRPKTDSKPDLKRQPPYNVILLDDNDHSFEYVIGMLQQLFGHPRETGFRMAWEVHTTGRVIVDTTSRERAELKQEQIHAFGPDPNIPRCQGSMSAVIEPAA
jgi:ATP-dependent Clp protease adaptor protein ClpS